MTVRDSTFSLVIDSVRELTKKVSGAAAIQNLLGGDLFNLIGGDGAIISGGDQ